MTSFSVVVTNWNYREFVAEAIDSALTQSHPPEQVVVVDDGSTDGSPDLLRRRYDTEERVTLLLGERTRGQLGAFQLGVGPARGDVICFLDSDDRWEPDYLARIGALYDARSDVDVVFSDARRFGRAVGTIAYADRRKDMGYSAVVTYGLSVWCGGPTSALSLRAPWARRSLDVPEEFLPDWRIGADSCLVLGSSVLGARKYFLPTGCVGYRVHDRNGSREPAEGAGPAARYREKMNVRRLIGHYARVAGIDDSCLALARFEFRTMSDPAWRDAWRYVALSLHGPAPWWNRVEGALDVLVAWLRAR